jgi:putative CocE/NonD family hydrolase
MPGMRTFQQVPFAEPDERADEVMVAMRDGVRLATDVYLPTGHRRCPVVLVRLPYDKCSTFAFMPAVAGWLNDRGYALVAQDVRGKVRSGGETLAFAHEIADGYDTLDWICRQPWCDGPIGMFGDSYYGFTQWAAAASGHPALGAIVPRNTTTHVADDWMYHGGAFCLATMAGWAAHAWVDNPLYECDYDFSVRPLAEVVEVWLGGRRSSSLEQWRRSGPESPYWSSVWPAQPARSLRIPALHVGGWWDVFRRGQIDDWRTARDSSSASQYLIIDATDHFDDELGEDGRATEDPMSPDALESFLPRYLGSAVEFFDCHLRGMPAVRVPSVRYRLANAGWRASETWPPPGLQARELFLADASHASHGPEGGALSARPDHGGCAASWVHDPSELVPTLDRDPWRPLLALPNERQVEARDDVMTFSADPSAQELDLVGPVRAQLAVGADRWPTQVHAKLVDVYPDGRAQRTTEGVSTLSEQTVADIDLGHIAYRVRPGHRLRLEVASSCFPRYLPIIDPGQDSWTAITGPATQVHLQTGAAAGSRLSLHVMASAQE